MEAQDEELVSEDEDEAEEVYAAEEVSDLLDGISSDEESDGDESDGDESDGDESDGD